MICNCACRCVLMILNGIFLTISLLLLAVGALFLWGKDVLRNILNTAIVPLLQHANINAGASTILEMVGDLLQIAHPVGIVLIVFAAAMLAISIIGYCGACCNIKILLHVYAGILGVLAVLHLILFIVYVARKDLVVNFIQGPFQEAIKEYKSVQHGGPKDVLLALIMPSLSCCGYKNGEEFRVSPNFISTDKYGGKTYTNLQYPIICCKMNDYAIKYSDCPQFFTDTNSNIKVGCEEPIRGAVIHYADIVAYSSLVILAAMVGLILFTVITIYFDVI